MPKTNYRMAQLCINDRSGRMCEAEGIGLATGAVEPTHSKQRKRIVIQINGIIHNTILRRQKLCPANAIS